MEMTIFTVMKQLKFADIQKVLNSAGKTKHIQRLRIDREDSSFTFFMDGLMYEVLWDEKEHEFEMVRYQDRRTFDRLGFVNGESLTKMIYKPAAAQDTP